MNEFTLSKATIKAKVLKSVPISEHKTKLHVLIKELEYEITNNNPDNYEIKTGGIVFEDYSKRGIFLVCDHNIMRDRFACIARQFIRNDIISFSIISDKKGGYCFTSLNLDNDFYEGSEGIFALIEKYHNI